MTDAFQNYSFDKVSFPIYFLKFTVTLPKCFVLFYFFQVLQYFHRQKPLKYRLDVRSNAWNLLCEQQSPRTLADSITSCFDVLQTIQDIFLKNFTAAVVAVISSLNYKYHTIASLSNRLKLRILISIFSRKNISRLTNYFIAFVDVAAQFENSLQRSGNF